MTQIKPKSNASRSRKWWLITFGILVLFIGIRRSLKTCGGLDILLDRSDCEKMYTSDASSSLMGGLAFSRDGRFFAVADYTLTVVDTSTGKVVTSVVNQNTDGSAVAVAISPDGKNAASISQGGDVLLTNVETYSTTTIGLSDNNSYIHTENQHILFSPDSKNLLFSNYLGDTAIYRIGDLTHNGHMLIAAKDPMAFSPDGKELAVVSDDTNAVQLFRFGDSLTLIKEFQGIDTGKIGNVAFSPDGKLIAVSSENTSGDTVTLWNTADGNLVKSFNTPGFFVYGVRTSFSPDSKKLAISSGSEANIYRLSDAALLTTLVNFIPQDFIDAAWNFPGSVSEVVFTPDGKSIYYAFGTNSYPFVLGSRHVVVKWRAP